MAGAGYKLFNTGDVLLASEVNTYLMQQTVMVFANASARTTALSGVLAEGMLSYLADTNATEVYDGSAWVSVSGTGDITAVTTGANSGLAGGVTTGNADIKINFASKGQLAVGTGSGTTDFLNVGTNGHTLVADSSTSTGLKWAAASSGGMTFITKNTFTNVASVTIDNIFSSTYDNYLVYINITSSTYTDDQRFRLVYSGTEATTSYYGGVGTSNNASVGGNFGTSNGGEFTYLQNDGFAQLSFIRVGNTNQSPFWFGTGVDGPDAKAQYIGGYTDTAQTMTGIKLFSSSGNVTGFCSVYGLAKS